MALPLVPTLSALKQNRTLINVLILDWDDTLCPTSHIFKQKTPTNRNTLKAFACNVYQFLVRCIQLVGAENVFIVTNGGKNWVQQSLKLLLQKYPKMTEFAFICNLLQLTNNRNGIQVVSAKHYYLSLHSQTHASTNGVQWKSFTFRSILNRYLHLNMSRNVSFRLLSIGDSLEEYQASKLCRKWVQQHYCVICREILCHTVKLKSVPSIDDMNHQISLLLLLIALFAESGNSCFATEEIDINAEDTKEIKMMQTRFRLPGVQKKKQMGSERTSS